MIIKFNDKVLTIGNKWCNGDNIPPLYENPTILYPKNTSVSNSLGLANLPTITQRYVVLSLDNKPYIPGNTETSSSLELQKHNSIYFYAYNWGAYHVSPPPEGWQQEVSFASAPRAYFQSFTPADNIGTTATQRSIGGGVYFMSYVNNNLYRNNEYTHFKFIFDVTTDVFNLYLNNVYVGQGKLNNPLVSHAFLEWYSGTSVDHSMIYGQNLKNVEIVSFNDFDSAVAYT